MAIWQFEVALQPSEPMPGQTGPDGNGPDPDSTGMFRRSDADVMRRIDRVLPRRDSWSESLLLWGEEDGNRLDAVLEDGAIVELTARIDLRQPSGRFFAQLVEFARGCDAHFLTADDRPIPADRHALADAIHRSDSFRFVLDPQQYIRELAGNDSGLPTNDYF